MIDIIVLFLRPALMAVDGKSRNPLHWLAALTVLLLDVIVAHTIWALIAGFPKRGEWTISATLERLCIEEGKRRQFFVELAKEINRHSPTGNHIQAVNRAGNLG